jgi:hypothetical protein
MAVYISFGQKGTTKQEEQQNNSNTMKKTIQKLQLSQHDFEMMLFDLYSRWCESITGNATQHQIVLANSGINAYFLDEFKKCETEFHHRTDRYTNLTAKDYNKCFADCTLGLFNRRPSALLELLKIKKASQPLNYLN